MPKKNDNIVGRSTGPAVNGGHQTPEQADIVKQEGGGTTDAERHSRMEGGPRTKGDPAVGGSSGGHSDQIASRGPAEGRKVAGGQSHSERTNGQDDAGAERRRS
jgi:hypothetical protein